jgi:hypothetical protein
MKKDAIDNLRKEIDEAKKNGHTRSQALGEELPQPPIKNNFLNELVKSRNTGHPNEASEAIKVVSKVSEAKEISKRTGQYVDTSAIINQHAPTPQPQQSVRQKPVEQVINETPDRFPNETISASIDKFIGGGNQPQQPPYGGNDYLNYQEMMRRKQEMGIIDENYSPQQGGYGTINEQTIQVISESLNENFASLFSEALKSNIVENYKKEKVAEALRENYGLIKNMVKEVILELQERNKKS